MKKVLVVLAVLFVVFVALVVMFVSWANKPENVEAAKERHKQAAAQKIEDEKARVEAEKRKVELAKEIEVRKASLKLVAEESFAGNKFVWLENTVDQDSTFQFKDNKLKFVTTLTKGQGSAAYRILGKAELSDFVAELEVNIGGSEAYAGIVWTAPKGGKDGFQTAYSSPSYLFVETDGSAHFKLGGMIASENEQKIRVERFSESLKVSVNGKLLFDGLVEAAPSKVGLYIGHGGGVQSPKPLIITIKRFTVWKP